MVIAKILSSLRGKAPIGEIVAIHIDYANRAESGREADFVERCGVNQRWRHMSVVIDKCMRVLCLLCVCECYVCCVFAIVVFAVCLRFLCLLCVCDCCACCVYLVLCLLCVCDFCVCCVYLVLCLMFAVWCECCVCCLLFDANVVFAVCLLCVCGYFLCVNGWRTAVSVFSTVDMMFLHCEFLSMFCSYCARLGMRFEKRLINEVTRGITDRAEYERVARDIRYDFYRQVGAAHRRRFAHWWWHTENCCW